MIKKSTQLRDYTNTNRKTQQYLSKLDQQIIQLKLQSIVTTDRISFDYSQVYQQEYLSQ